MAAESSAPAQEGADNVKVAHQRGYEVRGEPRPNCCLQLFSCSCSERGGCCNQYPAQVVVTQDGAVQRVNLIVRAQACCSNADTGVVDSVPPELSSFLAQPDAQRFISELRDIGQLRSTACFEGSRGLVCLFLPCMWPWLWGRIATEVKRWNDALLDWQRRFNAEVLQPRGMLVKTQSHAVQGSKSRHVESWIAFAMNPTESARLANEPHLTGDIKHGDCGGMDETDLVLLP